MMKDRRSSMAIPLYVIHKISKGWLKKKEKRKRKKKEEKKKEEEKEGRAR